MNNKHTIALCACLFFVGAGCVKNNIPVNTSLEEEEDVFTAQEIAGMWEYHGETKWGGETSILVDVHVSPEDNVEGTISGILSKENAPAAYIDEGTFSGTIQSIDNHHSVTMHITWEGDRSDNGSAVMVYDQEEDVIDWSGTVLQDDGLFTFPETMYLLRRK